MGRGFEGAIVKRLETKDAVTAVWANEEVPKIEPVIPSVTVNDPVIVEDPVIVKDPVIVEDPVIVKDPVIVEDPVIVKDPSIVNDPVTACEPVKYSKLPSISVLVSGEPFTDLSVKFAIFIYKY